MAENTSGETQGSVTGQIDVVELDPQEAIRRFPPVTKIMDGDVYNEMIEVLGSSVPEYFFKAPAASSYDFHNPYACGKRGLWIHTLMVATAYERLVDSYLHQGLISPFEAECGRAAVLLHDVRKYGDDYHGQSAAKDHDLQAAEFVEEETDLPTEVVGAIASHMGPWYEGPDPETPLQQLVHQADMAASTKNGTFGIYEAPLPIKRLYPSIPGADLSDQ